MYTVPKAQVAPLKSEGTPQINGANSSLDESSRSIYNSYLESPDILNDMSGKLVAITGTSRESLGYYIALAAVKRKAKVVLLLNRESSRSKEAQQAIQCKVPTSQDTLVQTVHIDLQDFSSVHQAVKEVKAIAKEYDGLDVLCANAGIMATNDVRTKDGFEIQMQTNMLSHFLLAEELFASLEKAADARGESRIVMHSSSARHFPNTKLNECFFMKSKPGTLGGDSNRWTIMEGLGLQYGPWQRYHQSKLANACFAMALHDKLSRTGRSQRIKVLAVDPGICTTNLSVTSSNSGSTTKLLPKMFAYIGQSPSDGSTGAVVACFGKFAKSGEFYMPENKTTGRPIKTIEDGKPLYNLLFSERATCDQSNWKLLWNACEKATKVRFEV